MILALTLILLAATPDGAPLRVADLPAYKSALESVPSTPIPATFRAIWADPSRFLGRSIRVEGKVARRFRQPAVGAFPALCESWIFEAGGDPICIVHPDSKSPGPAIGSEVRFLGTFLKMIRYRGGDVDRLAPLVVGGAAPGLAAADPGASATGPIPRKVEILAGIVAAGVVALILAVKHANPPRGRPVDAGPPPRFVDEEDADGIA